MPSAIPTPLLSARDLVAVLVGDAGGVRVLDGVDFDLAEGEVVDIVGPSGSGKSTFVRALARLLPTAAGRLSLNGRPADDIAPATWRARVTLLPQKPVVGSGSVRDDLTLPWRFKVRSGEHAPDDARLRDTLAAVGLSDVALDREAVRLSVGQQARLGFGRVALTEPTVLLLDEADAALDDESAAALTRAVAAFAGCGGTGVVRVRHRADDGLARRRMRLADGRLEEVQR